jgi:hypothetical protein
MARRAGRISSTQAAKFRAQAEKSIAGQIKRDIDRKVARGVQEFAVKSMNSLAQAGPAWTGEFSASWGFAPEGVQPQTPGITGRVYKYTKYDVPIRYVENLIKNGVARFSISNTSPHASIAIDESTGVFERSGVPIKIDDWEFGDADPRPGLRYDIGNSVDQDDPDANSSRTAPPDWYANYLLGGAFQKDLSVGFSFGFEER